MPIHFGEYLLLDHAHQKYTTSLSEHAYKASLLYMISVEMIELRLLAMYFSILLVDKPLCNIEMRSFVQWLCKSPNNVLY
jgi:hypothetical protein